MASIVNRKRKDGSTGYKVQWRLGGSRSGPWQSETFDDRRAAAKFQVQVEANGHRWPDGWVKGVGFSERVALAEEIPLVEFGTAHIRRLTKAGPHTQTTYLKQLNRICAQLAAIKRETPTVQNVTTDDDQDWIVARIRFLPAEPTSWVRLASVVDLDDFGELVGVEVLDAKRQLGGGDIPVSPASGRPRWGYDPEIDALYVHTGSGRGQVQQKREVEAGLDASHQLVEVRVQL